MTWLFPSPLCWLVKQIMASGSVCAALAACLAKGPREKLGDAVAPIAETTTYFCFSKKKDNTMLSWRKRKLRPFMVPCFSMWQCGVMLCRLTVQGESLVMRWSQEQSQAAARSLQAAREALLEVQAQAQKQKQNLNAQRCESEL